MGLYFWRIHEKPFKSNLVIVIVHILECTKRISDIRQLMKH